MPAKTVLPIVFAIGFVASLVVLFSVRGGLPREQSRASEISALEAEISLCKRELDEAKRARRDDDAHTRELQLQQLNITLAQVKQRP